MRSDIAQGDGMYKSVDGGQTWQPVGLADIAADRPHPGRSDGCAGRLRRGARPPVRAERRARRVPLARRRRALGRRCSGPTQTPARSTSPSSPGTRGCSTPRCGRRGARRGTSIRRRTARAAALYKSTDGGDSWTRLTGDGLPATHGRIGFAIAPSAAGRASTLSSTRARAGASIAPTTRRALARASAATPASGSAAGTSAASRSTRATPTRLRAEHDRAAIATTAARLRAAARAIRPATTSTSCGSIPSDPAAADPRRRPGRDRHAQRRRDVELLAQPADRPVLPRRHRQPIPVLGLRRAAGFRRGGRAEPQRRACDGDQPHAVPRDHRRRRERQHRARSQRSRRRLRRPRRPARPAHRPDARRRLPRWPYPDLYRTHVDAAARRSRGAIRASSTSRTSSVFRTDDGGEHWAQISPDLTREDPGVPPTLDPVTAAVRAAGGPAARRRLCDRAVARSPTATCGRAPTTAWSGARGTKARTGRTSRRRP